MEMVTHSVLTSLKTRLESLNGRFRLRTTVKGSRDDTFNLYFFEPEELIINRETGDITLNVDQLEITSNNVNLSEYEKNKIVIHLKQFVADFNASLNV